MYTYERLLKLCGQESNYSDIARYLLMHMNSLNHLKVKKVVEELGISKASLHRFYHQGGYSSFKDLLLSLDEEIKIKLISSQDMSYSVEPLHDIIDCQNIDDFIKQIKHASQIAFYGNEREIIFFSKMIFYLFSVHCDVMMLNRLDLSKCYDILERFHPNDLFIMVESSWRIQGIYEKSLNTSHMLNLEKINEFPFIKFYIGEADTDQWQEFHNIKVPYGYYHSTPLYLEHLDDYIYQHMIKEMNS